ncbi:MAG: hypothetical protein LQ341_003586 [Variospora aurantia]|nr:MAG: hypothetical protein LQ341_003586 [Variospora aurantia]
MAASADEPISSQNRMDEGNSASKIQPKTRFRVWKSNPFVHYWQKRRRSGKDGSPADVTDPPNGKKTEMKEPGLSPRQPSPQLQTSPCQPTASRRTALMAPQLGQGTPEGTSLAQYPHHDNKGAVGWVPPKPSPDSPYPRNTYVNGQRVLAQYGHPDDKWGVKHPVY